MVFWLNAQLIDGKWKWLTDGSTISTSNPAWWQGYPEAAKPGETCLYAFIEGDVPVDSSWATQICTAITYDFVCELADPDA